MDELVPKRRRRSGIVKRPKFKKFNTKIRRKKGSLTGVAAGLAEHVGVPPLLFRLGFIATTFFSGLGLLLYIILAVFLPMEETVESGLDGRFQLEENNLDLGENVDLVSEEPKQSPMESLVVCPGCDTVSKPYSKFCHKCGTALS